MSERLERQFIIKRVARMIKRFPDKEKLINNVCLEFGVARRTAREYIENAKELNEQ
jgi:hypothetical protein